jgi:hypothetical protein
VAAVVDVDADGWLDVVTVLPDRVLISRQVPSSPGDFLLTFNAPLNSVSGAALGHVDRDGLIDLVVSESEALVLRLGSATPGQLRAPEVLLFPDGIGGPVHLGDVDGDGWLDILLSSQFSTTHVYLQDRNAPQTFAHAYDLALPSPVIYRGAGYLLDVDADSKLDFVVSDLVRGGILVRGK